LQNKIWVRRRKKKKICAIKTWNALKEPNYTQLQQWIQQHLPCAHNNALIDQKLKYFHGKCSITFYSCTMRTWCASEISVLMDFNWLSKFVFPTLHNFNFNFTCHELHIFHIHLLYEKKVERIADKIRIRFSSHSHAIKSHFNRWTQKSLP
jgi:hypothetical protein